VDQYVCSLLLPFKEICEVLRPSTPNNESKLFIKLLCTSAINHEKEKQGTVEYCLRCMLNDMNDYAILLYNVLIQNSIDLNEYQQNTGVYLRKEWNPANGMFFNIGDWDLIENLPLVETDNLDTEGVTIDAPQKKAEKPINTRTINEIELGKCFNAKFKGAGNNRNLFELLVSDLKDLNTIKDCSAVAVLIWESKSGFIKPSHAFAKWCRIFFGCINIKVTDNYNYSKKTKPTEELKRKFYYLV
jgi:hypothetical protein